MRTNFHSLGEAENYLASKTWNRLGQFSSGPFDALFYAKHEKVLVLAQHRNTRWRAVELGEVLFDNGGEESSSSSSSS